MQQDATRIDNVSFTTSTHTFFLPKLPLNPGPQPGAMPPQIKQMFKPLCPFQTWWNLNVQMKEKKKKSNVASWEVNWFWTSVFFFFLPPTNFVDFSTQKVGNFWNFVFFLKCKLNYLLPKGWFTSMYFSNSPNV